MKLLYIDDKMPWEKLFRRVYCRAASFKSNRNVKERQRCLTNPCRSAPFDGKAARRATRALSCRRDMLSIATDPTVARLGGDYCLCGRSGLGRCRAPAFKKHFFRPSGAARPPQPFRSRARMAARLLPPRSGRASISACRCRAYTGSPAGRNIKAAGLLRRF